MATKKIKHAQDLKDLHARMQPEIALRLEGEHHHHGPEGVTRQVLVCVGGGCLASGAQAISAASSKARSPRACASAYISS